MGKPELVTVVAESHGIIVVNGRAGTISKGMTLDVDLETAKQYDFLKTQGEDKQAPQPVQEDQGEKPRAKSRGRKQKAASGDQGTDTNDERIP